MVPSHPACCEVRAALIQAAVSNPARYDNVKAW